jgi:DNA-binding transcriptional ArsR family regulator
VQVSDLELNLGWIAPIEQLSGLLVHRGASNVLTYDDGITLAVRVLEPSKFPSAEELVDSQARLVTPGTVTLVAGAIPVAWRSTLRAAAVSFIDVSGVAELNWPRLRVATGQFAQSAQRQRSPVPMQQGHAVVVQELLINSFAGRRPTIGELAASSNVGLSTASRSIAQLAAHGLVEKQRHGKNIRVEVTDAVALAELLAARTAGPQEGIVSGYVWGRNIWEIAASVTSKALDLGLSMAVTGRTALAFLGVLGTSSPSQTRCWVGVDPDELDGVSRGLGLEPASIEDSNVMLMADPWNLGVHGRAERVFDKWTAIVAHPIRTWCDLRCEPRGKEFAAQLWKEIDRRG